MGASEKERTKALVDQFARDLLLTGKAVKPDGEIVSLFPEPTTEPAGDQSLLADKAKRACERIQALLCDPANATIMPLSAEIINNLPKRVEGLVKSRNAWREGTLNIDAKHQVYRAGVNRGLDTCRTLGKQLRERGEHDQGSVYFEAVHAIEDAIEHESREQTKR